MEGSLALLPTPVEVWTDSHAEDHEVHGLNVCGTESAPSFNARRHRVDFCGRRGALVRFSGQKRGPARTHPPEPGLSLRRVNELQSPECTSREISSICVRLSILLGFFFAEKAKTRPAKVARKCPCVLCSTLLNTGPHGLLTTAEYDTVADWVFLSSCLRVRVFLVWSASVLASESLVVLHRRTR